MLIQTLRFVAFLLSLVALAMAIRAGMASDWPQGCFWLLADIAATLFSLSGRRST